MDRQKITGTRIFKFALISSILLFLSIWFGQSLWSELWIIYGIIWIGIVFFFIVTVFWGLIFWIRKKREYKFAFLPLLITITFLGLIIILPIKRIKNRLDFVTNKKQYEVASNLVLETNNKQSKYPTLYMLPDKFKFLSVGGGEVMVINNSISKGVLFYTFRGTPDGMSGFLNIKGDGKIDHFKSDLNIITTKDLGDNWYFITGG